MNKLMLIMIVVSISSCGKYDDIDPQGQFVPRGDLATSLVSIDPNINDGAIENARDIEQDLLTILDIEKNIGSSNLHNDIKSDLQLLKTQLCAMFNYQAKIPNCPADNATVIIHEFHNQMITYQVAHDMISVDLLRREYRNTNVEIAYKEINHYQITCHSHNYLVTIHPFTIIIQK